VHRSVMLKASFPQALKIVAKVFRCVEARLAIMSALDHVARNIGQVVSGFARHEALLQPIRTLALFIYSAPLFRFTVDPLGAKVIDCIYSRLNDLICYVKL